MHISESEGFHGFHGKGKLCDKIARGFMLGRPLQIGMAEDTRRLKPIFLRIKQETPGGGGNLRIIAMMEEAKSPRRLHCFDKITIALRQDSHTEGNILRVRQGIFYKIHSARDIGIIGAQSLQGSLAQKVCFFGNRGRPIFPAIDALTFQPNRLYRFGARLCALIKTLDIEVQLIPQALQAADEGKQVGVIVKIFAYLIKRKPEVLEAADASQTGEGIYAIVAIAGDGVLFIGLDEPLFFVIENHTAGDRNCLCHLTDREQILWIFHKITSAGKKRLTVHRCMVYNYIVANGGEIASGNFANCSKKTCDFARNTTHNGRRSICFFLLCTREGRVPFAYKKNILGGWEKMGKTGRRKALSLLLALSMLMGLMPSMALAEDAHASHAICGASCEEHSTVNDWTAWGDKEGETTSLPNTTGNYYLTKDVKLSSTWTPASGTVLCLNGYSIKQSKGTDGVIVLNKNVTFTLCDCKGESEAYGKVTHSSTDNNHIGVYVSNGAIFNMYGGEISENSQGVEVYCGTFKMYGGSITGNSNSSSNGGGVYVNAGGTFEMRGGSITNNTALNGGGVYVLSGALTGNTETFKVSGNVRITGNKVAGADNNVYLSNSNGERKIEINSTLGDSALIGVTTETKPYESSNVTVATGATSDYAEKIVSDSNTYETYYDGSTSQIMLKVKPVETHTHTVCNGEDGCGESGHTESHAETTFTAWGNSDTEKTTLPTSGAYYLTDNVILASTAELTGNLTLCLNGHSIIGANGYSAIKVGSGKTLIICDCQETQGSIKHEASAYGCGVVVDGGGNEATTPGGTFRMYGGRISGNSLTTGFVYGAGVLVDNGIFQMYGGEISGNKSNYGGGVCIYDYRGIFQMYGGTIKNNAAGYGGGVYISGSGSGKFVMYGGTVTGNNATTRGGGVYVSAGFYVSGSAKVTGNTLNSTTTNNVGLDTNESIDVIGKLDGASIGVTPATAPSGDTTVKIAKGVSKFTSFDAYTVTEDDAECFTADAATSGGSYYIAVENNTLVLGEGTAPHKHKICQGTACKLTHDVETWTGTNTLTDSMAAGYYYLTDNVTLTSEWKPSNNVYLCLNGYKIEQSSTGNVIYVNGGVTLTICDCKGTGSITHSSGEKGRGVEVSGSGSSRRGTLNMYGGKITGNSLSDNDINGGGVYVGQNGYFNLYGGEVSDNHANDTNESGGGVYVDDGTFTMEGGKVSGNTAKFDGGGVSVHGSGTFNMKGGEISGNTHTDTGNTMGGSGVYVFGSGSGKGSFTMSGGTITGNSTNSNGGGVFAYGGTFVMSGGTITGNNAGAYGGGVCFGGSGASFTVSNKANVTGNYKGGTKNEETGKYEKGSGTDNNVWVGGIKVNVSWLAEGAGFGLSGNTAPTADTPFVAATTDGNSGLMSNKTKYFTSDNAEYKVEAEDEKLVLKLAPGVHSSDHTGWTEIADASGLKGITSGGNYYLTANIELSGDGWMPANGVNLCLNGYSITQTTTNKAVIYIGTNNTLTLCDCRGTGTITHSSGTYGRGVTLGGGTFIMNGGIITGNNQSMASSMTSNDGGGVGTSGNGTFVMNGGTIKDNVAKKGGGVYVGGSSGSRTSAFTINGGSIIGNKAAEGGGVYVHQYTAFTMTGGTIAGNSGDKEGGVSFGGTNSTFTVSGKVQIKDNVKGGTTQDATTKYWTGGTVNNVYLWRDKTIQLSSALTSGSEIGVTTYDAPTSSAGVTFATTDTYVNMQDMKQYFKSDDDTRHVSGSAYSSNLSLHQFKTDWTKDSSNHWHACLMSGCEEKSSFGYHDTNGSNGACSVCGYKASTEVVSVNITIQSGLNSFTGATVGTTWTLKATPASAVTDGNWNWTTSDESVLSITDGGATDTATVEALKAGSAIITASYVKDGTTLAKGQKTITVVDNTRPNPTPDPTPDPTPVPTPESTSSTGRKPASVFYSDSDMPNKVTIKETENGSIISSMSEARTGTRIILTPDAAMGYDLDKLKVLDKNGNVVTLAKGEDGTYSFIMPDGGVTISSAFAGDAQPEVKTQPEMETQVIDMVIGSTTARVNSETVTSNAAPVILNDRTMVPIRFITETLGGTVTWNENTQEVVLTIDGREIKMTIGQTLDAYGVAPTIINDRTFVPVRFVADELFAMTAWDKETKTVTITRMIEK